MRKLLALALAVGLMASLAALIAGCGNTGTASTPSASAAARPTKGGVLTISYQDEPASLDPAPARCPE